MTADKNDTPGLFVHVEGHDDGEHFDTAQQLADALGAPVHEPTWPDDAGPRRYILSRALPHQPSDTYDILAEVPNQTEPLIVHGNKGQITHMAGKYGWRAVPELAEVNGLAQYEGTVHVAVERSGMSVHLTCFRSVAEAIKAAQTLREFMPSNR